MNVHQKVLQMLRGAEFTGLSINNGHENTAQYTWY